MLYIVLLCLLIIAFAAFVYKQDGTDFTKLTNYSSFDLLFDREARKLNTIYNAAQKISGDKKILLNVHILGEADIYKIPAIVLHESGVHILTDVDKDGWIVGSDRSIEWSNIRYKKQTTRFENPVLVNRRYVYALRDNMIELPDEVFQSVIVFNNGCSFQKIETSSDHVDVLKVKELKQWATSLAGDKLTASDIDTIYNSLKDKMEFKHKIVVKKEQKQLA